MLWSIASPLTNLYLPWGTALTISIIELLSSYPLECGYFPLPMSVCIWYPQNHHGIYPVHVRSFDIVGAINNVNLQLFQELSYENNSFLILGRCPSHTEGPEEYKFEHDQVILDKKYTLT